jgi:hypothetical protein
MDMTWCPECGAVADVQWRDVVESTDGPVEIAKIVCADRHWLLLPVASLERASAPIWGTRGRDAQEARNATA